MNSIYYVVKIDFDVNYVYRFCDSYLFVIEIEIQQTYLTSCFRISAYDDDDDDDKKLFCIF